MHSGADAWHRGRVRNHKETERRFRRAPFPLYGLPPSWKGGRFLGGSGWSNDQGQETVHELSLVHGAAVEGRGPTLVVQTATPGWRAADGVLLHFADFLWHGDATTPAQAMVLLREEAMTTEEHHDLTPLPVRGIADISIEDRLIPFDVFFGNGVWVGRANVGSNVVTVRGREWDFKGLSLVLILDIEPYIDGTRRFEALIGLASRGYGPINKIDSSELPPGPTQP
jgi:hypothetical protein